MKRFVTIRMWDAVVGILAIAMFAGVLSLASPANASVINVDWVGDGTSTAYVGLGAAPDSLANNTWNGRNADGWVMDFLFSDGTAAPGGASGIKILKGGLAGGYRAASGGLSLFDGYTGMSATNPPVAGDATWMGLNTSAKYDVYLYAAHAWMGASSRADFTVNGVTQSIYGSGTPTVNSFVPGTNYVKFANQSPDAFGNLNVNFFGTGWPGTPMWSGMQLATVVPEPGTLALLTTGLVALLCYAWRKRK